ncbi:hypothetical protein C8F01DRAFT_1254178 [Mycena amicta]|nr:hypothetical protein C8F01DRAFT_1254178 [Mycena amicta]
MAVDTEQASFCSNDAGGILHLAGRAWCFRDTEPRLGSVLVVIIVLAVGITFAAAVATVFLASAKPDDLVATLHLRSADTVTPNAQIMELTLVHTCAHYFRMSLLTPSMLFVFLSLYMEGQKLVP